MRANLPAERKKIMKELTEQQKELLKVAQLSTSELPKKHKELHKMIWDAYEAGTKAIQMQAKVKPVCGYCKDCKFWKQESLECKNDIIWLNKDKNVSFNISDRKTNKFFGCVRFEIKKRKGLK